MSKSDTRLEPGAFLAAGLLLAMGFVQGGGGGGIARGAEPPRLVVNTRPVPGVVPREIRGAVFVPLRAVAERTRMGLTWTPGDRTVRVYPAGGGSPIILRIGSDKANIDGRLRDLAAAPIVRDGRTWVSLRSLEDLLPETDTLYNAATDVAFVNTDETEPDPVIRPGFPEASGPNSLKEGFVDPLAPAAGGGGARP